MTAKHKESIRAVSEYLAQLYDEWGIRPPKRTELGVMHDRIHAVVSDPEFWTDKQEGGE